MTSLPPDYSLTPAENAFLVNITPKSQFDFQTGYLGVSRSTVAGEVQIKQIGLPSTTFQTVELVFRGAEKADGPEVELFYQKQVLWSAEQPSTSGAAHGLPASLPFEIELTPDLPHCVHTHHSSLEYTLLARLIPNDGAAVIEETVPVHLTRYLPASDRYRDHAEPEGRRSRCTDAPTTFSLSHPTVAHISLGRTIYRRSEPIELRVRLLPPSRDLVQEKGVNLRSVAAQFVRKIKRDSKATQDSEEGTTRTVLARSGKGARFSGTRDVFLRLWLQPAASPDGETSCETITQSTILHTVEFYISVSFTLSGREGDRETIVLERRILVLPDQPPSPRSIRTEKQREAEIEVAEADDDALLRPPAPRYQSEMGDNEASTSTPTRATLEPIPTWWDGEDEEEYDGYEEETAGAELRPAPPTIDEDSAPPSLEESDGVSSHGTDLNRPLTPSDDGSVHAPALMDGVPPPEYHGDTALGQQPPAYSASRRADEVEVLPAMQSARRRTEHGVV